MKQDEAPILLRKTKLTPEEKLKKVLKAKLKIKIQIWKDLKEMRAGKLAQTLGTTTITNQALIDLLFEKGIMTRQELMDKIEEIKKNLPAERVDN